MDTLDFVLFLLLVIPIAFSNYGFGTIFMTDSELQPSSVQGGEDFTAALN